MFVSSPDSGRESGASGHLDAVGAPVGAGVVGAAGGVDGADVAAAGVVGAAGGVDGADVAAAGVVGAAGGVVGGGAAIGPAAAAAPAGVLGAGVAGVSGLRIETGGIYDVGFVGPHADIFDSSCDSSDSDSDSDRPMNQNRKRARPIDARGEPVSKRRRMDFPRPHTTPRKSLIWNQIKSVWSSLSAAESNPDLRGWNVMDRMFVTTMEHAARKNIMSGNMEKATCEAIYSFVIAYRRMAGTNPPESLAALLRYLALKAMSNLTDEQHQARILTSFKDFVASIVVEDIPDPVMEWSPLSSPAPSLSEVFTRLRD
uniref:Uncharacterized protein n=1 Tax=Bracon brevicornis TaxID=1563983 RepID=A0A6V7L7C2_9HYME